MTEHVKVSTCFVSSTIQGLKQFQTIARIINSRINNFQELSHCIGPFLFLEYCINFLETESLDSLSM